MNKIAEVLTAVAVIFLVSVAFAAPVSAAEESSLHILNDSNPGFSQNIQNEVSGDYSVSLNLANTSGNPHGYYEIPGFSVANTYTEDELNGGLFSPQGATTLPAAYDLRDLGLVTSVKRQSPYGSCWAFSIINSIESNTVKKGYETNLTADFSELQLIYFMYNRKGVTSGTPLPSLSGLKGDDVIIINGDYLNRGGGPRTATLHLATGIGVARESDVPYDWAVTNPNLTLPLDYAVDKNAYVVSNVYFATPVVKNDVKELLMKYGCGTISYMDEDEYHNTAQYKGKNSSNYYQNQNDTTDANHMVGLVGWDDNYPKENFKTTPQNDGAWLIKNSWGADWGDGGYFWISYEDTSLTDIAFFEVRKADSFDNIYQYDGGVDLSCYSYYADGYDYIETPIAANYFTAKDNEKITDVSFVTINRDVSYKVEIWKNTQIVSSESGTLEHCGYHTVSLSQPVNVDKDEEFGVAVTFTAAADTVNMYGEENLAMITDGNYAGKNITYVSASLPDQGYLYYGDGSKKDTHGDRVNLRIKAFGVSTVTPTPTPTPAPTPTPSPTPKISAAGLSLSSDIAVRFYVNDANLTGYHDEYLEVIFDGYEYTLYPSNDPDKPRQMFVFKHLSPDEMGKTITANLYATKDGETFASEFGEVTYSVKDYCMNQINKAGVKNSLTTLCVDLLNYGSASQVYLGEMDKSKLVNNDLTATQKSWASSGIVPAVRNDQSISETGSGTVGVWRAASLNLYSDISFIFKFTTNANPSDLTATVTYGKSGEKTAVITSFDDSTYSGGACKQIKFNNLNAQELNYPVHVVLTNKKTGAVSKTLTYSVDAYSYSKMSEGGDLGNLVTSIMKYIRSVERFVGGK